MTIQELLDSLANKEDRVDTDMLPKDEMFYEDLVRECFGSFDPRWDETVDDDEGALRAWRQWHYTKQNLVQLLRYLLPRDKGTFRALLWITEWASRHPEEPGEGINALAGISSLLWRECPPGYSDEQLVVLFERYSENWELSVNAWQCLRSIAHRRPELRSKVLDLPPKKDRIVAEPDQPGK